MKILIRPILGLLWLSCATYAPGEGDTKKDPSSGATKAAPQGKVHEVASRIKPGMTAEESEAVLKPVLVRSGYTFATGEGLCKAYYHLMEGKELVVEMNAYPTLKVTRVGPVSPLSKWKGVFFDVDENDASTAIGIAVRLMNKLAAQGEDLAVRLNVSPAGRIVGKDGKTVMLTSAKGDRVPYQVTVTGRYSTHRIVELDFSKDGDWKYHVLIDLDDLAVVPDTWSPKPADIGKAKRIAERAIAEFLGPDEEKRSEVEVRAWGDYDYGPTRRIVVLVYTKPDGLGQSIRTVQVDIDNGVIHR